MLRLFYESKLSKERSLKRTAEQTSIAATEMGARARNLARLNHVAVQRLVSPPAALLVMLTPGFIYLQRRTLKMVLMRSP
ncbi:hypothetical protein DER72_108122 [Halomonas sp. A11-A]|nr:hypothetical protein DER72_108122 [Halomonas sp. A11-A]